MCLETSFEGIYRWNVFNSFKKLVDDDYDDDDDSNSARNTNLSNLMDCM